MKLVILGAGTNVPLPYLGSPSLALFLRDDPILFDMGPGALRQLARTGISHKAIRQIFISHFHPDHTSDLIHFLFATKNPEILKNRDPFTITGPAGLKELLKNLRSGYNEWLDISPAIMEIDELDIENPDNRIYNDYTVTSQPIDHTPNSLAYRIIGRDGRSFVYSGDTSLCDGIVNIAKNCDLLILECSFPDGKAVEGHLTPSQAGQIATLSGAKKLLLIHFYPEVLYTDITSDCRKTYNGEIILGRDMLHISI
jgi:ribonuclease BN (tRNA processing enzyme)